MLQCLQLSGISWAVVGYTRFLDIRRVLLAYDDTNKDSLERSKYLWKGLFDIVILWELSEANFDLVSLIWSEMFGLFYVCVDLLAGKKNMNCN